MEVDARNTAVDAPAEERARAWKAPRRAYLVLVVLLIALGVLLRVLGYFDETNGLWWDEASWLKRIRAGKFGIRPIGYAYLSQWLIKQSPIESVIRLPSLVVGMLTLPAFAWLASRARLSHVASLVGLFVLAVHPWPVSFAKEFKPYAADLFFHVLLAAIAAAYFAAPSKRKLAAMGGAALVAPLFSWSVAALYPGVLLAAVLSQVRRHARGELAITTGASILGLLGAAAIYVTRLQGRTLSAGYWGKKYGVFCEEEGFFAQLRWTFQTTFDVAGFPGLLSTPQWLSWGAVAALTSAFAGLCAVGAFQLLRSRDWERLSLFVAPWLLVCIANLLGLWPYGVFRTNLFLLFYPLGLGLVGFDATSAWFSAWLESRTAMKRNSGSLVPVTMALILCVPAIPFNPLAFAVKDRATGAESTSVQPAMRVFAKRAFAKGAPKRVRLVMDKHASASFTYYLSVNPKTRSSFRKLSRKLKKTVLSSKDSKLHRALSRHLRRDDFWLYISETQKQKSLLSLVRAGCAVQFEEVFPTGDFLIHCKPLKIH